MLMALSLERAMKIQLAKPWDSLAVSRRDLVAQPRAVEASQRAEPTRLVAFPEARSGH
jgi:hypothetical protein